MNFINKIYYFYHRHILREGISTSIELNQRLWSDIKKINQNKLDSVYKAFKRICKLHPEYDNDNTKLYLNCHKYRLIITYAWIDELIINNKYICFNMGGGNDIIHQMLESKFKKLYFKMYSGDLRKKWPIVDSSIDLIVSMEVLEHLSDFKIDFNESFLNTGLKFVLKEAYRTLKKDGRLFITTPNATSAYMLQKALRGEPPSNYRPHIREYTIAEIADELKFVGFEIEKIQTYHCCAWGDNYNYTNLFDALQRLNVPIEDRGDTIFVVAKKHI